MNTTVVVQARMGSTRLPGKILVDLGGVPALQLQLARLRPFGDAVVLATTTSPADDPVVALAESLGVASVRGPEEDVLARFVVALDSYPADTVVRVTADCPLIDPSVIVDALEMHRAERADYTSNTLVRTFPDGLDVEVIAAAALREAAAEASDPPEREHVTPFIYRRPERFRLAAVWSDVMAGDERWTLDTPADLERLRAIVDRLKNPSTDGWLDILDVAGREAGRDEGRLRLRPDLEGVDPGARAFVLEVDGVRHGRLTVPVSNGIGRVEGVVDPGDWPAALELLRRALDADFQVQELVPGPLA